ncbi:MAG: hypothetical protein KIT45_06630 [Fimbriimonadia bacterium]|nr:hypothetical protein [Fimbriimonadia bacterium]
MQAGRLYHFDRLRYRCTQDLVSTPDAAIGLYSALLSCVRGLSTSTAQLDILIEVLAHVNNIEPRLKRKIRVIGLGDGGLVTYHHATHDFETTTTVELVYYDVALYHQRDTQQWRVVCGEVGLTIDGGSETLFDGFDVSGTWRTPAGLPLLGICPELVASACQPYDPTSDISLITSDGWLCIPDTLPSGNSDSTSPAHDLRTSGGWDFDVGDGWQALPALLSIHSFDLVNDCSGVVPTDPILTVNDCSDAQVQYYLYQRTATGRHSDSYRSYCVFFRDLRVSRVILTPNLPKRIDRNDDYLALWHSLVFPLVTHRETLDAFRVLDPPHPDCSIDMEQTEHVQYAGALESRAIIDNESSDYMLARFANTPVPHSIYKLKSYVGESSLTFSGDFEPTDLCLADVGKGTLRVMEYPIVSLYDDVYGHTEVDAIRYHNSYVHPHWRLYYDYPGDSEPEWTLGLPLTKAPSSDYWIPHHHQYLTREGVSPSLARRNTLIDPPLLSCPANAAWIDASIYDSDGVLTSWIGILRFAAELWEPVGSATYTADSEDAWSVSDGTTIYGASGLTITPSSTSLVVQLDLGRFDSEPYQYPHIANRVDLYWSGDTIESITVRIDSNDGDSMQIATETGIVSLTPIQESVYAGSWARHWQALLVGYSETGTDLQSHGVSSDTLADPERAALWSMLLSGNGATLVYDITLSSTSSDVIIEYPVWLRDHEPVKAVTETAHNTAVLWETGCGIRHGVWDWWDGSALRDTPAVRAAHERASLLDALCSYRVVLHAIPASSGLDDQLSDLYDSMELSNRADATEDTYALAWNAVDQESAAIANAVRVWLVNAVAEVPPLACLPLKERLPSSEIDPAGEWVQVSYARSTPLQRGINPESALHLDRVEFDGGGAEASRSRLTTLEPSFGRWRITSHASDVSNDEVITEWDSTPVNSPRWHWTQNEAGDVGRLTPYHGVSSVVSSGDGKKGQWLSYDVSASQRHARAFVDAGTIWVGVAEQVDPRTWSDIDTALAGSRPCIRWDKTARQPTLWLLCEESSAVMLSASNSEGRDWAMPITIASNWEYPTMCITRDGRVCCYGVRDGKVRGKILDVMGNTIQSEFVAVDTADETAIAVDEYVINSGGWRLQLLYRAGGSIVSASSVDGVEFA